MSTFNLEVVAIDKVFYKGPCEFLVFPGLDGEQGILPGHELMVAAVKAGELRCKVSENENMVAAVGDGFVEILGDKVVLIADFVEKAEDIDEMRAQRAKERAEERMKAKQSEIDFIHSQAALARAMARLKVSSKYKKQKKI